MIATFVLIQDTFREAMARKIFWGLFGLSTLMILFFLFLLNIDLVEGAVATVTLFGKTVSRVQDLTKIVRGVYAWIATFLYTWGMFLAVFASAGLTPSILEPGRIELLLSKPVSRTQLLLGRYLGNLLVIGSNATYLVLGTWVILGIKTGIWSPNFLITIPATVFVFAVLLAVIVLLGVLFESAALAIMVTVTMGLMSPILAQTTTMVKLFSSEWSRDVWRGLYYVLPKVYDIGRMTLSVIQDQSVEPAMPIATSAVFGLTALAAALVVFAKRDF